MEINSLRSIEAGQIPLERLASNAKLTEKEKLDEVSRQFEAILLRQIFSAAQKPLLGQGLAGSSASASIYQDMITEQLADSVSRSRALGLANSLGSELGRQLGAAETDKATDGSDTQKAF